MAAGSSQCTLSHSPYPGLYAKRLQNAVDAWCMTRAEKKINKQPDSERITQVPQHIQLHAL